MDYIPSKSGDDDDGLEGTTPLQKTEWRDKVRQRWYQEGSSGWEIMEES